MHRLQAPTRVVFALRVDKKEGEKETEHHRCLPILRKGEITMCNNCIHKAVCSIYTATGGLNRCEHFRENRKGRWIEDDPCCSRYCSICNFRVHDDASFELYGTYLIKPNYCPSCGADMRGAEDGK